MATPGTTPSKTSGGLLSARNIIIAAVIVVALCCVCGVVGFAGYMLISRNSTSDVGGLTGLTSEQRQAALVGTDFMTKLKNSDWAGAYGLCSPTLQSELGSAAALGKRISDGKAQPASWTFVTMSPSSSGDQIDGTLVFSSSANGTLQLVLVRAGSVWQVSGFNLQPAR